MHILRHYHSFPPALTGGVIALGNFDGVHLGHKVVIETAKACAEKIQAPCLVMTFEPHPVTVLRPETGNLRITSFRDKMHKIAAMHIDAVLAIPFTKAFSEITAERFIEDIVLGKLGARHIVTGYDFVFGHGRTGNAELLKEKAVALGFGYTQVQPVRSGELVCSSSRVRQLLRAGNVSEASDLLGHSYHITGKVRRGESRGRMIGFPTANIALHDLLRPALGVYAVEIAIDGDSNLHHAVANLGNKPTFGGNEELLEVHILDGNHDLYGKRVTVYFKAFIRSEQKFPNVSALKQQIEADCLVARYMLCDPKERRYEH